MEAARALYAKHPVTRQNLADMKAQFDVRQAHADQAWSLEEYFAKHDLGDGTVRVEDFKAAWSLSGVKAGPWQLLTLKGAYGNDNGTVRFKEVLRDLDRVDYEQGQSVVMTMKMGTTTAQHLGYTVKPEGAAGAASPPKTSDHASRTASRKLAPWATSFHSTQGPGDLSVPTAHDPLEASLMRTSHITPVNVPPNNMPKGSFNVTTVINTAVTQRCKSMHPVGLEGVLGKVRGAAQRSGALVETLQDLDTAGTGCVTLDAFLTGCARAGLTLKPDELDALRGSGLLRRTYDAAPELIEYASLGLH